MSTPEERVLARLAGGEAREPSPDGYQVVDADTVETPEGRRLRLDGGVDAPETEKVLGGEHKPGDPGGDAATRVMARLLQQPGATHETTGTGAYGRDIGRVTLSSGQDAGEYLASVGAGDTNRWSDRGMLAAERSLSGAQAAPDLVSGARQRDMAEIADARKHTQFDPYASARMPRTRGNAFTKGVARGTDQMQASMYAGANALGEFLGVDAMAEWGEQGMVRNMLEAAENPAEITDLDDIDSLSKFGTFAAETLGEFLPQAATMIVPGGGAAMLAKAGIGKALLTRAAAKMGTSAAGLAGRAGATGGAYVQGVGEVQMGLKDEGIDAPGTALAFGVPIAAADMIGLEATFLKAFKGADTGLGDDLVRGVIQEAAKRGLIGSGTEASTEAMQTLIEKSAVAYNDPEYDLFSPENIEEIKFAAAKGGVGGGVAGGASSVAGSTYRALSTEDQDNGQVTPPEDSPEAAPESAVDGPETADPVADGADPASDGLDAIRPVPDAPGQLDAQVEELRDPASTRDTVLSTTGEDFSTPPADGEVDVQTDHGTFRTNNPEQAARIEQEQAAGTFAEPQARDEATGEILFNGREGGKNLEATQAVVNERPDGTRTTEILTDDANVEADLQRAADMGREGDAQRVVPVDDVLQARNDGADIAQNATEQGVDPVHARTEREDFDDFLAGEPESSPTGNRLNLAPESPDFGLSDVEHLKPSTVMRKLSREQKEALRAKHQTKTLKAAVEAELAERQKPVEAEAPADTLTQERGAAIGAQIREDAELGASPSEILASLHAEDKAVLEQAMPDMPSALARVKAVMDNEPAGDNEVTQEQADDAIHTGEVYAREAPDAEPLMHGKGSSTDTVWAEDELGKLEAKRKLLEQRHPDSTFRKERVNGGWLIRETPAESADLLAGALAPEDIRRAEDRVFKGARTEVRDNTRTIGLANPQTGQVLQVPLARVVKLGWELNGMAGDRSAANIRDGLMSGLSHLMDKGRALDATDVGHRPQAEGALAAAGGDLTNIEQALEILGPDKIVMGKPLAELQTGSRQRKDVGLDPTLVEMADDDLGEMLAQTEAQIERLSGLEKPSKGQTRELGKARGFRRKILDVQQDRGETTLYAESDAAAEARESDKVTAEEGGLERRDADESKAPEGQGAKSNPGPRQRVKVTGNFEPGTKDVVTEVLDLAGVTVPVEIIADSSVTEGNIELNGDHAVIRINPDQSASKQWRALSHELGHLVQSATFDGLGKGVKAELHEAAQAELGGDYTAGQFDEWFAEQFSAWVGTAKPPSSVVERVFSRIKGALKKMWAGLHGKMSITFDEYMRALVSQAQPHRSDYKPATDYGRKVLKALEGKRDMPRTPRKFDTVASGQVKNFTPAARNAVRRTKDWLGQNPTWQRATRWTAPVAKTLGSATLPIAVKLRGMGPTMTELAQHFHVKPGEERSAGATFDEESRTMYGAAAQHLGALMDAFSETRGAGRKALGFRHGKLKDDERFQTFSRMLVEQRTDDEFRDAGFEDEIKHVRDYFEKHGLQATRAGIAFKARDNYFPVVVDQQKWGEGEAEITAMLQERLNIDETTAAELYEELREMDGGVMMDTDRDYDGPTGRFFKQRRELLQDTQLVRDLSQYMVDDVFQVMHRYGMAASKRSAAMKLFGPSLQEQAQSASNKVDPWQKLNKMVEHAQTQGEVTADQARYVKDKIIPALQGRLGNDISHELRTASSMGVFYQNLRVLPFATLSSFLDLGYIVNRAGNFKEVFGGLREVFSKAKRDELRDLARDIGSIHDDVIDHVFNDSFMHDPSMQRMHKSHDMFFRAIGLAQWTDTMRLTALSTGRKAIAKHARRAANGDQDSVTALEELGLSTQDLDGWNGREVTPGSKLSKALNRWVDGAVLRPSAAQKTVWMNDPHWALIAHLKGFMYATHDQVLQRLVHNVKSAKGMAKLLPPALLLAATLPLAAAGYELRRFITGAQSAPKEGADYGLELVQRSGLLGAYQMVLDGFESEDYGRMAILSVMGPTVGQFEQFLTKDLELSIPRAVPGVSAFHWLRDPLTDALK